MMKNLEDNLEALDNYFSGKSEAEKWLSILVVAGLIGYLFYLYLFPYAHSRYQHSLMEQKTLRKKIAEDNKYLGGITVNGDRNYYPKKYTREIRIAQNSIKEYNKKISLLDQSFKKLSEVLFNRANWAKFLNSITKKAHENVVKIINLENHYVNDKKSFGHVLEVSIECKGKFQNIMGFLNDLEQNKLVTDVYSTNIRMLPNGALISDLNISVWGVNK